jgi:ADP-ribose pyrophosphatase YjhB (NUDIX family)
VASDQPALPSSQSRTRPGIAEAYGGRIRVRVGALVFDDDAAPGAVLLVEHDGVHEGPSGDAEPFWIPPGGGVDFGESLAEAVRREAEEEAGLDLRVGPLRYTLDFVRPPLHTVSFYFQAHVESGTPRPGADPELGDAQLIRSVRFVPFDELPTMNVYPEGLGDRLPADARAGFPGGVQYLGTLR